MIAFLRRYTDRSLQLCVADSALSNISTVGQPELVSPDRPYSTGLAADFTPQNIDWSPDDKSICFSRVEWFTFPDGEKLAATGLWKYTLATGAMEPLATHPKTYEEEYYFYHSPRWSPDGKRLAFLGSSLKGENALFVRTIAGTRPDSVTPRFDRYEDVGWPAWSPDGTKLAFRQRILRSLSADPVETIRIIAPGFAKADTVLTLSQQSFWKLPFWTGSGEKRQRDVPPHAPPISPVVTGLCWRKDGGRLAFALAGGRDEAALGTYYGFTTWILDVSEPNNIQRAPRIISVEDPPPKSPVWISTSILGAIMGIPGTKSYLAISIPLGVSSPSNSGFRIQATLPSDDFDWSPDRRSIVCAVPGYNKPGDTTTLQLIPVKL